MSKGGGGGGGDKVQCQNYVQIMCIICMQLLIQCMDSYHKEEHPIWNTAHFPKWSFAKGR